MKRILLIAFSFCLMAGAVWAQGGTKPVELSEVTGGLFAQRTAIGDLRSMSDGEHYTQMNPERTMVISYAYRTGLPVDTLFSTKRAKECTFDTFDGYMISSTGHRIIIWRDTEMIYRRSWKADMYDYDVRRNYLQPLSNTKEKLRIPTFSPDGRMCAYVKEDNNIWIRKFDFDSEVQVTKDGKEDSILNGVTDWVYEEEFTTTNLMAWSPESDILTWVRTDETDVLKYDMQVYGNTYYPDVYSFKYPKVGEKNSTVTLHSYDIQTRDIKRLSLPAGMDYYIPRIRFTTQNDQLAVMTMNRNQNDFNMYYMNPRSGVSRLVLHEADKYYVDFGLLDDIVFFAEGFTYVSERDGYKHVYLYSPTGVMLRQVTTGKWDVTRLYGYNEKTKEIFYESAEESPLRRAVYKIDAKGRKTKLSKQVGTNTAQFSRNFAYYINTYSSTQTPAVITVNEVKSGKVLRTLIDNAQLKERLATYSFSPKEFTTVKTASGQELNAWIVKPVNFDPNRKYPVLMVQYSGPDSQEVLDKYSFGWEHYLAANDVLVISVDGRGTGARGSEFRKCTYMKLGDLESIDQIEAAQALAKLPYVDGSRMAIWGWSFGGYNTLMAMSRGNGTFKAGIAVAPPTDWRYYDTVYTERYMRTSQENVGGYDATSPIRLAANLQGKLLLVHGTADDNVHVKQTLDYAEALVQAGKQFDMHLYRDRDHGIYGGNTRLHLYTKMSMFLFNNL